jgi:hypothetical protein
MGARASWAADSKHLQRDHALGRVGVDEVSHPSEIRPLCIEPVNDRQQAADGPRKTIALDDDQDFAGSDIPQHLRAYGAVTISAGGMLLKHFGTTSLAKFFVLGISALVVREDPRGTNKPV